MVTKAVTPRALHGLLVRVRQMVELVFDRMVIVDDALALFHPAQDRRQAVIGLRADDHVDGLLAAQNFRAFRLRHAAGDAEQHVAALKLLRLLDLADAAKLGIDFLGGLFADVAGVDEDEVGVFENIRPGIAFRRQLVGHALQNRRHSSGSHRS